MPLRIGQWYAYCCIEDLKEVEDEEEIEEIMELSEIMTFRVWDTKKEALAELEEEEAQHG